MRAKMQNYSLFLTSNLSKLLGSERGKTSRNTGWCTQTGKLKGQSGTKECNREVNELRIFW